MECRCAHGRLEKCCLALETLFLFLQANNFTAESKLMCFFVYFSITAVISFSALTVGLRNVSQNQQLFVRYFECQSFGVDPNNPCILEVDRRRDQALTFMFAVLLMFAPYTVMVYVVPVDKLKEKWQSWIKKSAP